MNNFPNQPEWSYLRDEPDWEGIVNGYQKLVFVISRGILGDVEAAKDVGQTTILKAYIAYINGRGPTPMPHSPSYRAWLCRIAVNEAINCRNRGGKKRLQVISLDQYLEASSSEPWVYDPDLEAVELNDLLDQAMLDAGVKEEIRRYLEMEADGYTQREIADATATPLGTVASRISRSKHDLQDKLKEPKDNESNDL
jgi:RNA polymerase sigma factor (sigma-70 family)